jgi:hypothetical protein
MSRAITKAVSEDLVPLVFGSALKLRFFSAIEGTYELGPRSTGVPGFAASAGRARSRFETQLEFLRRRRAVEVAREVGRLPEPYQQCPCGSTAKFKFCCGRRIC